MFKAFKYRLYPTAPQAEKINQNIGCARFVYNQLLDDRIKVWKETKQRSKKTYSILKDEHEFLKKADSRALKHAQANLDEAYEKFFKEPLAGFPKFKSKHKCRWSYTTDNNNIVCSDGERVASPKHFRKSEQRLARVQRAFSRTQKDSKGHEKARLKVARCHQKIKNQRNDFLQKLSTKLIRENQVICLEDLSVKGMERNKKLANSVSDASFSKFVSMLEYKAEWYGRKVVKIDRFYPSTQLCSGCGYKNESIKGLSGLKFREWICPECGEVHDRDLNAARNILKEGLKSIEPTERGG